MNTPFDSKLNFLEIFHDFKQSGCSFSKYYRCRLQSFVERSGTEQITLPSSEFLRWKLAAYDESRTFPSNYDFWEGIYKAYAAWDGKSCKHFFAAIGPNIHCSYDYFCKVMTLFGNREALKKAKLNKVANSSNLVKGNDDVIVVVDLDALMVAKKAQIKSLMDTSKVDNRSQLSTPRSLYQARAETCIQGTSAITRPNKGKVQTPGTKSPQEARLPFQIVQEKLRALRQTCCKTMMNTGGY